MSEIVLASAVKVLGAVTVAVVDVVATGMVAAVDSDVAVAVLVPRMLNLAAVVVVVAVESSGGEAATTTDGAGAMLVDVATDAVGAVAVRVGVVASCADNVMGAETGGTLVVVVTTGAVVAVDNWVESATGVAAIELLVTTGAIAAVLVVPPDARLVATVPVAVAPVVLVVAVSVGAVASCADNVIGADTS